MLAVAVPIPLKIEGTVGGQAVVVDGSGVTQPISAATLPLPSGAAQEHTAAATPSSSRLSDGSAFYDAAKTGQLPAALAAGGGLKIEGVAGGVVVSVAGAVTNAGTFAVQDSQKIADNAPFTNGTTPVQPIGLIVDETAGAAIAENDIGAARMDTKRAIVVTVEDRTNRGDRLAITSQGEVFAFVQSTQLPDSSTLGILGGMKVWADISDPVAVHNDASNPMHVRGPVLHDDAVGAFPQPVIGGARAQDCDDTAPPNRVSAENDVAIVACDRDGAIYTRPHGPQIWTYHKDGSAALTDDTVHAAPGAGLSLYITDIIVSVGAATAMNIFFEEGSTKVMGPWYLENVNGRGLVLHFVTPKKITANTALTLTTSQSIAHTIDINGFIAQG